MSALDRRARLNPDHGKLSIRRQCALLGVARSSVYRQRQAANDDDLAVMRRLDELFTAWPFLGSPAWRRCCGRKGVASTASACPG
jgi:putative transposase